MSRHGTQKREVFISDTRNGECGKRREVNRCAQNLPASRTNQARKGSVPSFHTRSLAHLHDLVRPAKESMQTGNVLLLA